MRTRSWFIVFAALILAGLADFSAFASLPTWLQAHDLEWLPRTYGPMALLAGKTAMIVVLALLVARLRRWRSPAWAQMIAASTIVIVALCWAYGAWTNIANSPGWLNQ